MTGFLADVDPGNQSLVARQRTLFGNLRQFGFAQLAYQQLSQQYCRRSPGAGGPRLDPGRA